MKILIVKTGLTETFDLSPLHPGVVSLGDVVRSTVVLSLFPNDEVTWLTSPEARLLLESVPQIKEVVTDKAMLYHSSFDLIVNLERDGETLQWMETTKAHKRMGFCDRNASDDLRKWLELEKIKKLNWSEKLYLLLDQKWEGQNYFIPHALLDLELQDRFAIGLNWQVGVKWPTKSWPKQRFVDLEKKFSSDFKVSWQEGFDDLLQYMNWINSCRIIVTHDSLGFHLAKALGKKIVVLFGPTSSTDTPLESGIRLLSAKGVPGFDCLPCYKDQCHNTIHCMEILSVDMVEKELRSLLGQVQ